MSTDESDVSKTPRSELSDRSFAPEVPEDEDKNAKASIVQIIVFGCNFLLLMAGAVILGIGVWISVSEEGELTKVLESAQLSADSPDSMISAETLKIIGILLAISGFVLFITSFLGCCGAAKHMKSMLYMFMAILGFVVLVELGVITWANVKRSQFEEKLKVLMKNAASKYSKNEKYQKSMDDFMQNYKCCGVESTDNPAEEFGMPLIPAACCEPKDEDEITHTCPLQNIFPATCLEAVMDYLKGKVHLINGVCAAIVVFQVLLILLSCQLVSEIKEAEKEGKPMASIGAAEDR